MINIDKRQILFLADLEKPMNFSIVNWILLTLENPIRLDAFNRNNHSRSFYFTSLPYPCVKAYFLRGGKLF